MAVDIIHQEFRWITLGFPLLSFKAKEVQCNSRDISVSYILIYERRNNLLIPSSSLLNDTSGIPSSDSTPDIMIQQSVIKEPEKQKK